MRPPGWRRSTKPPERRGASARYGNGHVPLTFGSEFNQAAKNQATINPSQTLFEVKRLIGRRFKDSTVQKGIKLLPFEMMDKISKPFIKVKVKGEDKIRAPEEVSSMVLTKMKEAAENYLGKEVKHAVVTVPAYSTTPSAIPPRTPACLQA